MSKSLFILSLALLVSSPSVQAGEKISKQAAANIVIPGSSSSGFDIPSLNTFFKSGIYGQMGEIFFFGVPPVLSFAPLPNTTFEVYTVIGNRTVLIGHFTTDSESDYSIGLPPGTYYIVPEGEGLVNGFGPIVVQRGQSAEWNISFFSGPI